MPSLPLEQFLKWEQENPDRIFLRQPVNGIWKTWTWAQAGNDAKRIAHGFLSLGLKEGDHVALLSKNCAQWIIADLAFMMAGCVSIPVYLTLSGQSIEPILIHSVSKAIIVSKHDDYTSHETLITTTIININVNMYGIKEEHCFEEISNRKAPITNLYSWKETDILTIIYPSG